MPKQSHVLAAFVLGLFGAGALVSLTLGVGPLSQLSGGNADGGTGMIPNNGGDSGNVCGPNIPDNICLDDATLKLAAFNQDSSSTSQVAASIYSWKVGSDRTVYLGSKSGSASSRTDFTHTVGRNYRAIAFDDTYEYGAVTKGEIDSKTLYKNLKVWKAASKSNIGLTVYDENGDSTTSVNLGADQQYGFSKIKVEVTTNQRSFNPKVVAVKLPDKTNVSSVNLKGDNVKELGSVPDAFGSGYDYAFRAFPAKQGEPLLHGWDSATTGKLVVTADSDGTNGETMTVAVADSAPFINNQDRLAWGIQTDGDNPSFTGVGSDTSTVTLN